MRYLEETNKVKSDLENNWVLNQLRQYNHNEQFIDDYIKIQATLWDDIVLKEEDYAWD